MRGVEEADGGIGEDSGGKARERDGGKRGTGKAGGGEGLWEERLKRDQGE